MMVLPSRTDLGQIDSQAIHQARRIITDKGILPNGMLRGEIEASWKRCMNLGLEQQGSFDLELPSNQQISALHERNKQLINSSVPEMEALLRHFGEHDSVIMLADHQATVLKSLGGQGIHKQSRQRLKEGASWLENNVGTNGIGTVIKQQQPIFIHGNEHYLDSVTDFYCSAAPIFSPCGAIAGVLDVTSDQSLGVCHNLGLVCMSARLIENRLFVDRYQKQILIAVHNRPEFVDSLWQGMLAFNEQGQLLAFNREAGQCVELSPTKNDITTFEQLFGVTLSSLIDQNRRTLHTPQVLHREGAPQLYGRLLHLSGSPKASVATGQDYSSRKPARTARDKDLRLEDVVFEDQSFERAARQGVKALNHQIPLLLQGETGSGKEALAKALHGQSERQDNVFVAVNCAAIPEGLIESELFGYKDGAFTGARRGGMQGKFQQADGGTLFLDEIGDMPQDLQARLLRVLQEQSFTPLGSSQEIKVDINVICATHRNLKKMVADGSFREDLYYRLNGVTINIPALRDRTNFADFSHQLLYQLSGGNKELMIAPLLVKQLQDYSWPGNVRQLQTVLKTCLAFMDEQETLVNEEHLTEEFLESLRDSKQTPTTFGSNNESTASTPKTLKSAQLELIQQAIKACDGNLSAAAISLGISRATLYRKLQNAGIKVINGNLLQKPESKAG